MRKAALTIALLLLMPALAGAATIDPAYKFNTIETGHFLVHYHQGIETTAARAATIAEQAHSAMSGPMMWEPYEKTNMVLVDKTDLANGWATVLPYNLIYIYTVPPEPDMSIGQYEDWLRMVITHEYAHILSMDHTRGYASITRSIFGKPLPVADPFALPFFLIAAPPVIFAPGWWHEGLAVWAETEFAEGGRGKSTYYEMLLRTAVAEDRLPRIDMLNGDHPDWPAGGTPYIYGLVMARHISRVYGADTLFELNHQHAGRLPYLISAPAVKKTGRRYGSLYAEAVEELKEEQAANIEAITGAGLTVPALLPVSGQTVERPTPSADGSLLAVQVSDPHTFSRIAIVDSGDFAEVASIRVNTTTGSMAWRGRTLYYTDIELSDGYNSVLDLYSYDIDKDRLRQLGHQMRLKDPAVSAAGRVAVINISAEAQSLALFNEGKTDELVRFTGARLSHPSWDPEGRRIVFSAKQPDGTSSIYIYDTTEESINKLISQRAGLNHPSFTEAGDIVYASDQSGVPNIYLYDMRSGKSYPISNLLGGAYHPVMKGDRIYFSSYTAGGFRAAYIPTFTGGANPPRINARWPEGGFVTTPVPDPAAQEDEETQSGPRKYSALSGILPRFWLPTVFGDNTGIGPGFITAAQDPLFYHTWFLTAGTGNSGKGYYYFQYRYDRSYPSLNLTASRLDMYYDDLFAPGFSLDERQDTWSASLSFPLRRIYRQAELEIGYEYRRHTTLEAILPVFEGRRDNIFIGFNYNSARGYPYSISRQEGRDFTFTARDYSRSRGSDLDSREYSAICQRFFHLGGHRVLYIKLAGARAEGDAITQQAFRMGGSLMDNLLYPLRGYEAGYRTGDRLGLGTLELRLPVLNIQRGPGTMPVFARQLHVALFADTGATWDSGQSVTRRDFDVGAGLEIRTDLALGYMLNITPALGYAHGFSKDTGKDMVYFVLHVLL